ncbi:hypothetical protein CIB48_g12035 [Xylaria polymorpha]|nr:hypothetical protein CIB48_g12035 [Xylaria polymorpha]
MSFSIPRAVSSIENNSRPMTTYSRYSTGMGGEAARVVRPIANASPILTLALGLELGIGRSMRRWNGCVQSTPAGAPAKSIPSPAVLSSSLQNPRQNPPVDAASYSHKGKVGDGVYLSLNKDARRQARQPSISGHTAYTK